MPLHKPCRSWRKPLLDWRGCRDDHDSATDCASPGFVPVAGNRGPVPLLAFRFDETVARPTLECIGNSDALYHDIEHTMLVALVGHDILGRTLQRTTTADDYANFILASLTHDIGYVRGIVQGDGDDAYVADLKGRKVQLPVGSSDAALAPYHVDRSKLFVIERLDAVEEVDAARIAPPSSTRIVPQARAQTKSTVSSTHLSVIKQAPQSNGASNAV